MKLSLPKKEPAVGITALAIVALLAGIIGMWVFQHQAELKELHGRLSRDANEMVRQMQVFNTESSPSTLFSNWIPLDLKERLLEVRNDRGGLLYRSPRLLELLTPDREIGLYRDIDGQRHRFESFQAAGLMTFINADLDPDDNFIHEIGGGLLLAVPAMFAIIVVGGLWLKDRALRPVQSIRDDVARVTAHSLDRPLQPRSAPEEISELVSTLNVTFKSLSSSFEQAARFSANASHQLKTPLAVLRLGIEELLADPHTSSRQRAHIDELLTHIHRITSIVEKLLLLSRADAGRLGLHRKKLSPTQLFSDFLDDISALAQDKGIVLEVNISAQKPVLADPDSVAIILENLMENAIKYNRPNGRIELVISDADNWTNFTIGNSSEPIPPDRAAHIFDRFVRGSCGEEISGSGLGLSIARELAEANYGQLDLTSLAAGWTEFRLRLPNTTCADSPYCST